LIFEGPYICAETQGGGIPQWLIAKKNVRIRHSNGSYFRRYDPKYCHYFTEWWTRILEQLKPFQFTASGGSLLALQIENESFEHVGPLPLGIHDDMRYLCQVARDIGISVPFFTNDGWEAGSFIAHKSTFGIDLYGFDKYVVFAPVSSPEQAVLGLASSKKLSTWEPRTVESALDRMEQKVRRLGGNAANSPIFIPELQGGWFNHYALQQTYDDLYLYYGEDYTRLIFDSVTGQGVSMLSFYMFYGGTNWGCLGDPDVYTSYDYSACIREFRFLSGRGRKLRLALSFVRSFWDHFAATTLLDSQNIVKPENFLYKVRQSCDSTVKFVFLRNFDRQKKTRFHYSVHGCKIFGELPYKQSFITLMDYPCKNGLYLFASSLPIHAKMVAEGSEIWIVQNDSSISGEMAFSSHEEVEILGTGAAAIQHTEKASILKLNKVRGWTGLKASNGQTLYIIQLLDEDLYTLTPFWNDKEELVALFWGATHIDYHFCKGQLTVEHSETETLLFGIFSKMDVQGWTIANDPFSGLVFLQQLSLRFNHRKPLVEMTRVQTRTCQMDLFPWKPLPLKIYSNCIKPGLDLSELYYTSGHAFYKISFQPKDMSPLSLQLNMRHRCHVYLDGNLLGYHMTYSHAVFRPGAKIGPDVGTWAGWHTYDLPLLDPGTVYELICVVENFGLNRQPFFFDDVHNPRGILEARIVYKQVWKYWLHLDPLSSVDCQVTGVNTRFLSNPFETSGFPDEHQDEGWVDYGSFLKNSCDIPGSQGPKWIKVSFTLAKDSNVRIPVRLRVDGLPTAFIWINHVLIAKYYGNGDGPQHDFYVMEGLLKPENELKLVLYGHLDTLSVKLLPWTYSNDTLAERWSGNVIQSDHEYRWTVKKANKSL
jgi:hypothetical protein